MAVEIVTEVEVHAQCVRALGLDPQSLDLSAPEAIAAALRRAASFSCPTTANRLVSVVEDSLTPVVETIGELRELIADVLAAVVGYGDLLELDGVSDDPNAARAQLYLAPPSFVRRGSGSFLLFGIRPEAAPLVGEELLPLVHSERHVRTIRADAETDVLALLVEYGLRELPESTWLNSPRQASAKEVREHFDSLLLQAGPSGTMEGVSVLDSSRPVRYYKGRWRSPTSRDNGNFVARRPQAYGASIWCYAAISAGVMTKAIDLPPAAAGLARGCDTAWYLQAAIDAAAGHPEVLRLRTSQALRRTTFEIFSPPPSWLQRRWDVLGTPVVSRGALAAYVIDERESAQEADYAKRMLWLDVIEEPE